MNLTRTFATGAAAVVTFVTVVTPTVTTQAQTAPQAAYATIMFGRTGWQPANHCTPMPQTMTLGNAVDWLATQDLTAVGGLTTDRTAETSETCDANYILYPSWQQLEDLQARDGFDLVSQSATYTGWPQATTTAAIQAESCDTLPVFQQHGFNQAWGLFNPPDNHITPAQMSIVDQCFAFNRKYQAGIDQRAVTTTTPYTQGALSVTSGNCNDPALPCYTKPATGLRYTLPARIDQVLNSKPGTYNIVQWYRFVTGAKPSGGITWDCTSPNVADHWVSSSELYCYNDFQTAIQARAPGVIYTDPDTVAMAWEPARAQTIEDQQGSW